MSTKIMTGFRLQTTDLFEIHAIMSEFRASVAELQRRDVATLMARMACDIIDRRDRGHITDDDLPPINAVLRDIRTRQKEILGSGYRDPEIDFDFEISLMPFDGQVFGMVFSERQLWIDTWMARPEVDEFAYWNNTDRPSGLTAEEWSERARVWDAILRANPAGTPGMAGFTAQCADRMVFASAEEMLACLPTFQDRVVRQARSAAVGRVFDQMNEKGKTEDNPFATMMKIERWLDREGAHILREEEDRLRLVLSPEITVHMLLGGSRPTAA